MLRITIPAVVSEDFNDQTGEFVYTTIMKEQTLVMEHSLVSLSKWEAKWCKPFLDKQDLSGEEAIDYYRCMTITPNVDPEVYNYMTRDNIQEINDYIAAPMTATTFSKREGGGGRSEVMTSELLYYYMIALNIPFECQKWHLNRLITLVRVCNIKNTPGKKMSRGEVMRRNAALNAQRRKRMNTRG